MTKNNPLEALFKSGLNKEQFIAKYKDLKAQATGNDEDMPSVFDDEMDASISALFDTLNTNKSSDDDVLDEVEIQALRQFSNDNDNNENITENDLKVLYDKTAKRIQTDLSSKTPEEIYRDAQAHAQTGDRDYGTGNAQQYIASQIEALKGLLGARESASESKIRRYESQLDNLIITQSNLSEKDKRTYTSTRTELNNKKAELKKLEQDKDAKKLEMELTRAEIEYLKNHKDTQDPAVKSKIDDLTSKYNTLSTELNSITGAITQLSNQIGRLNTTLSDLSQKAKSNNAAFEQQKKELLENIEREKASFVTDRDNYESQISNLEAAQSYATQQAAETYPSDYYDEDTSNFSYDAQELQNKWKAKWTRDLGGEAKAQAKIDSLGGAAFFNKVCAVAQRLNCDANALMGVMNSESGVRADIGNSAGGSAVGLIQFMPKTAQELFKQEGIQLSEKEASARIRSMSAIEQLNYVEKMINYSKKIGGIGADEKVDSGTLYTLVFLPAYAKRDVLTVKGHKFYSANAGLDLDGDEKITKADMARRVREKMA